MRKYELTDESIKVYDRALYRIRAFKDFSDVKKGDLGGFVESENNLSHQGNCWVYYDAAVYGKARVCENAKVYGNARVYDNAMIHGRARVYVIQ